MCCSVELKCGKKMRIRREYATLHEETLAWPDTRSSPAEKVPAPGVKYLLSVVLPCVGLHSDFRSCKRSEKTTTDLIDCATVVPVAYDFSDLFHELIR